MAYRSRRRIRIKRTFNLSERTVDTIRELAVLHDLAASQDAVVELAISELQRQVADREDARLWALAAADRRFNAEVSEFEAGFGSASDESWPTEAK